MNFGLDINGDLDIQVNNLTLITGKPEIMQIVKSNLQAVAGEWFLDLTLGLPWFDQILEKQNSGTNIDAIFIDAIRSTDGVLSVVKFQSALDKQLRNLSIEFSIATLEGILEFAGVVQPGGGS